MDMDADAGRQSQPATQDRTDNEHRKRHPLPSFRNRLAGTAAELLEAVVSGQFQEVKELIQVSGRLTCHLRDLCIYPSICAYIWAPPQTNALLVNAPVDNRNRTALHYCAIPSTDDKRKDPHGTIKVTY